MQFLWGRALMESSHTWIAIAAGRLARERIRMLPGSPGGRDGALIHRWIQHPGNGGKMLYYTLVFLLIAIVAGLLGFGVIAFAAAGIARILFFIFLVMFLVSLLSHLGRGQKI